MAASDVLDLDATAQAAAIRAGELHSSELVEAALTRIDQLNPELNAVIHRRDERARAEALLGRLTEPEDVAGLILFLCSDAARQITGEVIRIDGGQCIQAS